MLAFTDYSVALQRMGIAVEDTPDFVNAARPVPDRDCWALIMPVLAVDMLKLIQRVMPIVQAKDLYFRLVRHEGALYKMNGGGMPHNMIGRSLTVFVPDRSQAKELLPIFANCTNDLQTIEIPVAVRIAEAVYVNHCTWSSQSGWRQSVPAQLPFTVPKKYHRKNSRLLAGKYWIKKVFTHTWKGSVLLASCFSGWKIRKCVIKMGRRNAAADPHGRNIAHRQAWERHMLELLAGKTCVPAVKAAFHRNGDHYLVLQHLPGLNALQIMNQVMADRHWHDLTESDRRRLLLLFNQMAEAVRQLHANGIVHRDLTPTNFILSGSQLYIIDFELAFHIDATKPFPPFVLGTMGFVAPEQMMLQVPTVAEDVYSLAAILYLLVTGQPVPADGLQNGQLFTDDPLTNLIKRGLATNPAERISPMDMLIEIKQLLTSNETIGV